MKNILKTATLFVRILFSSMIFAQSEELSHIPSMGITDIKEPVKNNTKSEIIFESITKEGGEVMVGLANLEIGAPLDIIVFDITGKKIEENHLYVPNVQLIHGIDATKMSEGIYIVTVIYNQEKISRKFYNI